MKRGRNAGRYEERRKFKKIKRTKESKAIKWEIENRWNNK
jgi:hypothetical protein